MIAFDFEYYKPTTLLEAVDLFFTSHNGGKTTIYYSGGTEFITFARVNKIQADVVVDLKGIPECKLNQLIGDKYVIGSAVTLNDITEASHFPLLGQTVKQIADHTSRNKITIGGNMTSKLMYRESILPLLVAEAEVCVVGKDGERVVPLLTIFDGEIKLGMGEFIAQIYIDQTYLNLPYVSIKKTRMSKVGYPLVSIAALMLKEEIRIALSGVCTHPFREMKIEEILSDGAKKASERIDEVLKELPLPVVEDIEGSAEYREFVLKNVLTEALTVLEGAK